MERSVWCARTPFSGSMRLEWILVGLGTLEKRATGLSRSMREIGYGYKMCRKWKKLEG
jgi:hypothetical protein